VVNEIPVPVPNSDNAGFWDACRRGELRLQRIFWQVWQDHPDTDSSPFLEMGLLRANGSPKPAYAAYQAEAQR